MEKRRENTAARLIISALGTAALAVGFIAWYGEVRAKGMELVAAVLSLGLFWLLCWRFVPMWLKAWSAPGRNGGGELAADLGGEPAAEHGEGKIFISLLALDMAVLLGLWLLRLLQGNHESFLQSLRFWLRLDSKHYMDIARDGYLSEGSMDRLVQLVFLPGYPLLVRLFACLTGEELYAGLLVSALSFAGAGVLVHRIFAVEYGRAVAARALHYLSIMPGLFFFVAPMSESLFLLCSVAALYLAKKRRWICAGLCAAYAAFTRSLGLSLIVPLVFEAAEQLRADCAGQRCRLRSGYCLKLLASLLLVPLGFALYLLINYLVAGEPFKFLEYQSEHWSQDLGWFFNTASYHCGNAAIYSNNNNIHMLFGVSIPNIMTLFGSLVLVLLAEKSLKAGYVAWFIIYYGVAMGATWLLSAPRYMAALPVLWLSVALFTENKRRHIAASLICALLSAAYFLLFSLGMQVW